MSKAGDKNKTKQDLKEPNPKRQKIAERSIAITTGATTATATGTSNAYMKGIAANNSNANSDSKDGGTNSKELYLEGPVGIVKLYNPELKKMVFLFGDVHQRLSVNCDPERKDQDQKQVLSMFEFMTKLSSENSNKMMDFFLEIPYQTPTNIIQSKEEGPSERGYMIDFFKSLSRFGCFSKWPLPEEYKFKNALCFQQYPNIRFHGVDMRFVFILNNIFYTEYQMTTKMTILTEIVKEALQNNTTDVKIFDTLFRHIEDQTKDLVNTLRPLREMFGPKFEKLTFENLYKYPMLKIEKYLSKNPHLFKNIPGYIYEIPFSEMYQAFLNVGILSKQAIDDPSKQTISTLNVIQGNVRLCMAFSYRISLALVFLMDLYSTRRILKDYVQHAFLFAGATHVQNHISILLDLGFQVEDETPADYSNYYSTDIRQQLLIVPDELRGPKYKIVYDQKLNLYFAFDPKIKKKYLLERAPQYEQCQDITNMDFYLD